MPWSRRGVLLLIIIFVASADLLLYLDFGPTGPLSDFNFGSNSAAASSPDSANATVPSKTSVPLEGRHANMLFSRRLLLNTCTNKDIGIAQGRDSSSSGIPQYVVQIVNTCLSDCAPSDVHVFCGWFASAPLVNPNVFRRIAYNDCLVNNGKPLRHGEIIRFQYANSFMYPLRFKSARFC
ncbi:hypothetical protein O6H91_Y121800 [Diphasiastrum complanatum]|nr:hypothetical protein O6H91_Y121800 [Diphasiastrum complanatum]